MKISFIITMLMLVITIFSNVSFASLLPSDLYDVQMVNMGFEYEEVVISTCIMIGGIIALIPIFKMLVFNKKATNAEEKLDVKFITKCVLFCIAWPIILLFAPIILSFFLVLAILFIIFSASIIRIKEENILLTKTKYYFIVDLFFFNILSYFMYFFPSKIIDVINYYNGDYFSCDTSIAKFIFYIISISCMLLPVLIAKFRIKEFNETIFDSEEKKLRLTNSYLKFLRLFSILGGIGIIIKGFESWLISFDKPIIYLYPEKEENIKVKLGKKEKLTCTYPKYEDSWDVIAKPNGDLTDMKTGRSLYALYWEGINSEKCDFKEGFCVKGEDSIVFLEEKLTILGLTEKEANEFIVYWLPRLEKNKYNLIRFETIEEINRNMPLEINPNPDTVIRVMMQFKGVKNCKAIKEQELYTPERKGFTVVEWGGTEIK